MVDISRNNYVWLVLAVMAAAGVLGGAINHFLETSRLQNSKVEQNVMPWWKYCLVGLGASLVVPVFLQMISSSLMENVLGTTSSPPNIPDYFVLAGFCILAAMSSRAFIASMSDKLLAAVKEAKNDASSAMRIAERAETIAEAVAEPQSELEADQPSMVMQNAVADLSEEQRKVLKAMANGQFALRSLSGIAKDAGLEKSQVNLAITELMVRGLVGQTTGRNGQPRLHLKEAGRISVRAL